MIGEQIKQMRVLKNLSVYRLSKDSNVRQGIISKIEKGGGANIDTLNRIAEALNAEIILQPKK